MGTVGRGDRTQMDGNGSSKPQLQTPAGTVQSQEVAEDAAPAPAAGGMVATTCPRGQGTTVTLQSPTCISHGS